MGLRKVGASQRSPNWKLVSRRGSFLISDANACARGNGRDVGVMTLTVHKFSFFLVVPDLFAMFPLNFSICLCFLPTKRSPPWLVIKTIKTLPRMVQWRWAVACVAAAAEVGTSDSASDVPKSPSGWWKPRGKGQTYAYYMHIIYIYSQFYEVGPPNIYYI